LSMLAVAWEISSMQRLDSPWGSNKSTAFWSSRPLSLR
jgi:hypothetical protein